MPCSLTDASLYPRPAAADAGAGPAARRYYTAADYHALYLSGEVTPLQVARAILDLIRRRTPKPLSFKAVDKNGAKAAAPFTASDGVSGPYSDAWITTPCDDMEEGVLAAARASTERYARGQPLSVLDGVPFGAKDDVDVEGYVTHSGMSATTDPRTGTAEAKFACFRPAKKTCGPVHVLRDRLGAVLVGKQVMHELGSDTTGCNPSWGTPRNWHNDDYFPGGSSSGAGSSIAAGIVPFSVATDAGGSIRIPSAFQGIFGLKPTHGRIVNMDSVVCVTGPMAATARDLRVSYRAMALVAEEDEEDPATKAFGPSVSPSAADAQAAARKVLGVPREWVDAVTDPQVLERFNKAVDWLAKKKGYELVDIRLPFLREGQLAHACACLTELVARAKQRASRPGASDWLDIINAPSRIFLTIGARTTAEDWIRIGQLRTVLMQHVAWLYETHGPGLVIATPTTSLRGWLKHPGDQAYGVSDGNVTIKNMRFIWLANFIGCPAVTCPAGYVEPYRTDGPAGGKLKGMSGDPRPLATAIMGMGQWGAEETLLDFADELEEYLASVPTAAAEGLPVGRKIPDGWVDVIAKAREVPREEVVPVAAGNAVAAEAEE